jgi:VIT1/CCC1 family predicted Fe2+/Mn2+ transporter
VVGGIAMTKDLYKKLIARPEPIRNVLRKIAEEELVEGKTELVDVKTINNKERIYQLTVINEELGIVRATVQLKGLFDDEGYVWKLLDLEWEGET